MIMFTMGRGTILDIAAIEHLLGRDGRLFLTSCSSMEMLAISTYLFSEDSPH